MTPQTTPLRIDLKKDQQLQIHWADGQISTYPIEYLRSICPCAACKTVRQENESRKSLLTVLPGNYSQPLSVTHAELVGNYALKLSWSDQHDTGIYSFEYLRSLRP